METLDRPAADTPPRRFEHGDAILHQGDNVPCLYLLRSGAVRLSTVLPSGREVVLGVLGPGDVFGEQALLGTPSPVDVRAIGSAQVRPLPLASIRTDLDDRQRAGDLLLRVAGRLHRTSAALGDALALDVSSRVSRRLCDLAERHGRPGADGVRLAIPLTQEDLARMVGASREAVNKTLGRLAARGLVRTQGRRYLIPDLERLAAVGGLDGEPARWGRGGRA